MTQRFPNGSVVRLKSGGPKMTIVEYSKYGYDDEQKYKCKWFDDKNKVTEAVFTEAELVSAEGETGVGRALTGEEPNSWMAR